MTDYTVVYDHPWSVPCVLDSCYVRSFSDHAVVDHAAGGRSRASLIWTHVMSGHDDAAYEVGLESILAGRWLRNTVGRFIEQ